MDFGNEKLNQEFRELKDEKRKLALKIYDLQMNCRHYPDEHEFIEYILVHISALHRAAKREFSNFMKQFALLRFNRNRVVITKSFTHDTGKGANRIFAERDGVELESKTIFYSGLPSRPSRKALHAISQKMAKKYNLPIQNNLDETGFNYQMIYSA